MERRGCEHFAVGLRLVVYERRSGSILRLDGDCDKAMNEEARRRAEEAAVAGLVSQYAGTLYRVAYSVLRNAADAEDAVQEAFVRVLRHRETLAEVRDQRVWLIRIVWNVVLDRKRRMKTRPETDDVAELARVLPADGAERRGARRSRPTSRPRAGLRGAVARQGAPGADALGLRGAEQRGDCRRCWASASPACGQDCFARAT